MKTSLLSLLLTFIFILNFSNSSQAQLQKGDMVASLSVGGPNFAKVGLNTLYALYFDYNTGNSLSAKGVLPPISAKFEYMIMDRIGVGMTINAVQAKITFPYGPSVSMTESVSKTSFLLRGNYHIVNNEHIDLYAGTGFGYNMVKRTRTGDNNFINYGNVPTTPINSRVTAEIGIGMRYFFSDNLAAFAEVGIGRALVQVGVCFKISGN